MWYCVAVNWTISQQLKNYLLLAGVQYIVELYRRSSLWDTNLYFWQISYNKMVAQPIAATCNTNYPTSEVG